MPFKYLESHSYFQIAGMLVQVSYDPPADRPAFSEPLKHFQVHDPSHLPPEPDLIQIHHHFDLPPLGGLPPGQEVYHSPPWRIARTPAAWHYRCFYPADSGEVVFQVADFSAGHTHAEIYTRAENHPFSKTIDSLALFPTDQIWLSPVIADRQGCIVHAAGMIIAGQGFLFVGHSEAGKSTLVSILHDHGHILCDDRIIVRRWPNGFKIHGTWSHGDVPTVSPASAPLRAVFLLEQSPHNQLIPLADRKQIVRTLPFYIVKPLVTANWWEQTLDLVGHLAREVPVYRLQFDKSTRVVDLLRSLL